ncbi:MAG: hypothetical protein M3024_02140 [Candidatus Dormibacteraeota bacterium]|nr:hypothetical protein [Candidatus Dormibacteraeota bacterium]
MTVRLILGGAWSLITGLAGGWLMLSPWALAQQPDGKDWTSVTKAQFWTGAGLVVLAVLGLVLVALQIAQALGEANVGRRSATGRESRELARAVPNGQAQGAEFETALTALAQALVKDLSAQQDGRTSAPAPAPEAPGAPAAPRPPEYRGFEG